MSNRLYTALVDLFQACSDLPIDEMNRMEKEINAASAAIKSAQNSAHRTAGSVRHGKGCVCSECFDEAMTVQERRR
jgi:hypothetical protein